MGEILGLLFHLSTKTSPGGTAEVVWAVAIGFGRVLTKPNKIILYK